MGLINKVELKYEMLKHGDTQSVLAKAMGISRTRLNYKINEKNDAVFTHPELVFIKERYKLSPKRIEVIFFANNVS